MYKITFPECVVIAAGDSSLIYFAKAMYDKNEAAVPYPSEVHWSPENVQQAKEYLVEYCGLSVEEGDIYSLIP